MSPINPETGLVSLPPFISGVSRQALIAKTVNSLIDGLSGRTITNLQIRGGIIINGTITVSTTGALASGATAILTGNGYYLDYNGGTPRLRIGTVAASALTKGLYWDGADLAWTGTNTSLTAAGVFTASNAVITGSITATSGTIGGWTINATSITDAAGVVGMSSAVTAGDDIRFWAGDATPANAEFRVTESGALTATSATITGSVTATTGAIGGWTIGASSIEATGNAVGMSSNVADPDYIVFWAGDATPGNAEFRVTAGGALTATSATITGTVNATAGYFGNGTNGVVIDSTGVTIAGTGHIATATSGARVEMLATGIKWYDATTQRGQILATGAGWLGASTTLSWTTAGVVTMAGWTADSNGLYTGTKTAYNDTNAGIHVGTDGIGMGNNVFTVSAAGALVATNATITGGYLAFGAAPATAGAIRLSNNATDIQARNAANAANIALMYLDSSDNTVIDAGATISLQKAVTLSSSISGTAFAETTANPATTGIFRLGNNSAGVKARNAANSADVTLLYLDANNDTEIDAGTGRYVITQKDLKIINNIYPGNQTTHYITGGASGIGIDCAPATSQALDVQFADDTLDAGVTFRNNDGTVFFGNGTSTANVFQPIIKATNGGSSAGVATYGLQVVGVASSDASGTTPVVYIDGRLAGAALTNRNILAIGSYGNTKVTVSAAGNVTIAGTLTVNGDQTGATDHVFDSYDDLALLQNWRDGKPLPFATGDLLNRDRLLRDSIVGLHTRIAQLELQVARLGGQA